MKNCKSILLTVISLVIISCEEKMPELSLGVPTMGEVEVTDNGSLVFELQGSLTSYENLVSECGFYIGTDASMEGAAKYPCKLTGKTFSTTLTLQGYNRKYYVCSYITNGRAELLSEKKTINIGPLNDYLSFGRICLDSYNVESESAIFSTTCTAKDGVETGTYGILYGTSSDLAKSGTAKTLNFPSGNESVTFTINNLKVGTKYYICQYLTDNGITAYGKTEDFDVYALPTVAIGDITDITASSATISGMVTDEGGTVILEKGIVYAEGTITPTTETGKVQSMGLPQDIAVTLTGLSPNTRYTVRAYATNSEGTAYSAESMTFTTLVDLPKVTTADASSITSTSAILNARLTSSGGETPLECGFYWSTDQFTDPSAATKVSATTSGTTISFKLAALTRATKYYYQPYARNSAGISYGEIRSFKTSSELPKVTTSSISDITSSEAKTGGTVTDYGGASITQRGVVWSTSPNPTVSLSTKTEDGTGTGSFTSIMTGLTRATNYYVRAYAVNESGISYGDERTFTTQATKPTVTTLPVTSLLSSSPELNARIDDDGGLDILEAGFYWSNVPFSETSGVTKIVSTVSGGLFKAQLSNLAVDATYYYQAYAINSFGISYGEQLTISTKVTNLSAIESANCYIVSEAGGYKFKTVKGNSSTSVGSVASCEVLWESFGTAATPSVGDLIKNASYNDGYIAFETATTFCEGNAVIAAKDASGNILWSWHIWLTDQPKGQTYNNGAGVMMDRNLGATSATPGDVGALGLLYQWGRKDPFLSSSSFTSSTKRKSTITWPSSVSSTSSTGTIAYATSHPTTCIASNNNNHDWYYSSGSTTDNTRWESSKTIYDPCPVGWRVPDGGSSGVWAKAFGKSYSFKKSWDSSNKGMDFSKTDKKLGSSGPIWYPMFGDRMYYLGGSKYFDYYSGKYWSATPSGIGAYFLLVYYDGEVHPAKESGCRDGRLSVRCLQE